MKRQKRFIWTGFEPFGGNSYNPSSDVAQAASRACSDAYQADAQCLPVEFELVRDWVSEHLDNDEPVWAIHIGLAEDRDRIHLERVARNRIGDRADEAGDVGSEGVEDGGPARLETNFPVEPLAALLTPELAKEGLPELGLSDDAGSYVCNAIYYHSLHQNVPGSANAASLFVHVPMLSTDEAQILGRLLGEKVSRLADMARMYED